MSPEQLAAVSQQRFTPGQAASPADLAQTADMLQVSQVACCMTQSGYAAYRALRYYACMPAFGAADATPLPILQRYRAATLGFLMQANPELMKQSLEMMRTMPPDQLQAAAQAAGAPPGFFSADRMEELAAQVSTTRTAIPLFAPLGAAHHSACICPAPSIHLSTAHAPNLPGAARLLHLGTHDGILSSIIKHVSWAPPEVDATTAGRKHDAGADTGGCPCGGCSARLAGWQACLPSHCMSLWLGSLSKGGNGLASLRPSLHAL